MQNLEALKRHVDQLVYWVDGDTSAPEVKGPVQGHTNLMVKHRPPDFQPFAVSLQLRLLST